MEGLHSIDVAVLLNPILVELMEGIAKTTGIEYVLGDVDGKEDVPDALLVQNAMKDLDKAEPLFEEIAEEREEDSEEGNEDIIEDKPKGLMARKENN
jgi:methionyl-tRNA synthetase